MGSKSNYTVYSEEQKLCYIKPIIESLNGWMKEELKNDFNLYKTHDIHKTIKQYIYYFNNERFAYSLKYKTQFNIELSSRLINLFFCVYELLTSSIKNCFF